MKKSGYNDDECMLIALNDLGIKTDDWILSRLHNKEKGSGKGFHSSDLDDLAKRYNLKIFKEFSYSHDMTDKYSKIFDWPEWSRYYISWRSQAIIINQTAAQIKGNDSHAVCIPLHAITTLTKPIYIIVRRKDIVTKRKIT